MAGQPLKNAWAAEKLSQPPKPDSTAITTNTGTPTNPQPPQKSRIMLRDEKGNTFVIDLTTNKAYPLQENANLVTTFHETQFASLITDDLADIVHDSMTPGDLTEYFES